MTLEAQYPALTALLDTYFRPLGQGDDAAVRAFLAAEGQAACAAVRAEVTELLASEPDPFELRFYLMAHRFEMVPDEGADAWLERLGELLDRSWVWTA
ncbi:MAG TPA: hypothetical protein VH877_28955 [Polyangia bacterium]|nr:hypothetical protein [Polyangia bacterium]